MSDDQEKYAAYPHTVLAFEGPPPFRIDLRRPLAAADRGRLAALGLGERFAVLTAENPEGENVEDAARRDEARARERANVERTGTLLEALAELGALHARVDGTAPDGSYRERCVAVALPLARALALAGEARQLALFWYDAGAFWLVPAEADAAPRRLPAPEALGAAAEGADGADGADTEGGGARPPS